MNNNGTINNRGPKRINTAIKNRAKKVGQTFNEADRGTKIFVIIIGVIVICLLIYYIVFIFRKNRQRNKLEPVVIGEPIDAWVKRRGVSIPNPVSGTGYSYSTWVYVRDWTYKFGKWKNILWKGASTEDSSVTSNQKHQPSIWFYPLTNSMKFVTSTTDVNSIESCDIQNIPLQKWVHIAYVLHNRSVDIYINGKLERTCILKGIPLALNNKQKLRFAVSGGFYGKLGRTQYFARPISTEEVANLYFKGPTGSQIYRVGMLNDGRIFESDRAEDN